VYQPSYHREDELVKQHSLIIARPLGLLVTNGSEGLTANPIPFRLHPSLSKFGVLRAHIARANPLWRDASSLREALVVFQGVDAYISPSWYATKRETGKVVPTWNYVSVHTYGPIQVIEDREWLRRQIDDLTAAHESGRSAPWSVDDAPAEFIDQMLPAIVGIEIEISRIEGKWKVSQNRTAEDRAGVAAGLRAAGDGRSLGMAALVEEAKKT
jgi:transcriptional regulator